MATSTASEERLCKRTRTKFEKHDQIHHECDFGDDEDDNDKKALVIVDDEYSRGKFKDTVGQSFLLLKFKVGRRTVSEDLTNSASGCADSASACADLKSDCVRQESYKTSRNKITNTTDTCRAKEKFKSHATTAFSDTRENVHHNLKHDNYGPNPAENTKTLADVCYATLGDLRLDDYPVDKHHVEENNLLADAGTNNIVQPPIDGLIDSPASVGRASIIAIIEAPSTPCRTTFTASPAAVTVTSTHPSAEHDGVDLAQPNISQITASAAEPPVEEFVAESFKQQDKLDRQKRKKAKIGLRLLRYPTVNKKKRVFKGVGRRKKSVSFQALDDEHHAAGRDRVFNIDSADVNVTIKSEKGKTAKRVAKTAGKRIWKGLRIGCKFLWQGLILYAKPFGTMDFNVARAWDEKNAYNNQSRQYYNYNDRSRRETSV